MPPDGVTIELDAREVRRILRRLSDHEVPRVMADALNRTSFEILDAERQEAERIFEEPSARGRQFLSGKGSFRFDKATPENLETRIFPNPTEKGPRREELLQEHRKGGEILPGSDRLSVRHELLAVPVGRARIARRRRGLVPKSLAPQTILTREEKPGFILLRGGKGALVERKGRGRARRLVTAFALVPRAKVEPRFDFYRAARDTALREFPRKARRAFEKLRHRI